MKVLELFGISVVEEGVIKNLKRVAAGKNLKSRIRQEITKSQEASMVGDNKKSKKHFDRFSKLDAIGQGPAKKMNEDFGSSDWFPVMRRMDEYIKQGYSIEDAASHCADYCYQDMGWSEPAEAEPSIIAKYKRLQSNAKAGSARMNEAKSSVKVLVSKHPARTPQPTGKFSVTSIEKRPGGAFAVNISGTTSGWTFRKVPEFLKFQNNSGRPISIEQAFSMVNESIDDKTAEAVFKRLQNILDDDNELDADDVVTIKRDITRKLGEGWLPDEIISYMKNMEEVNPHLDEKTAIARMNSVQAKVQARLKEGGKINEGMWVVKSKDGVEKRFKNDSSPEAKAWKDSTQKKVKLAVYSDKYWEMKDEESDDRNFITPWKKIGGDFGDQGFSDQIEEIVKNLQGAGNVDWTFGKTGEMEREGTTCATRVVRISFEYGPEDDMGVDEPVSDSQSILVARNPKKPKQIDFVKYTY